MPDGLVKTVDRAAAGAVRSERDKRRTDNGGVRVLPATASNAVVDDFFRTRHRTTGIWRTGPGSGAACFLACWRCSLLQSFYPRKFGCLRELTI